MRVAVFRWTPGDSAGERGARQAWALIEAERPWTTFIDRRGVLAHYALEGKDAAPLELGDERGAIFGPLYANAAPGAPRLADLDAARRQIGGERRALTLR